MGQVGRGRELKGPVSELQPSGMSACLSRQHQLVRLVEVRVEQFLRLNGAASNPFSPQLPGLLVLGFVERLECLLDLLVRHHRVEADRLRRWLSAQKRYSA